MAMADKRLEELKAIAEEGLSGNLEKVDTDLDLFERGRAQGQKDAYRVVLLTLGITSGIRGIHSDGCPFCGAGGLPRSDVVPQKTTEIPKKLNTPSFEG